MKKLLYLSSLFLASIFVFSCQNSPFLPDVEENTSIDNNIDYRDEQRIKTTLKFQKSDREGLTNEIVTIKADWVKRRDQVTLESNMIDRVDAIHTETGRKTSVAIVVGTLSVGCEWSISSGYAFDNSSGCYIYGTLIVGSDCNTHFTPAGTAAIALDPICPPGDDEWA